MSIDDILSQVFVIMHTHINIYILTTHTYPHTYINNVLPIVYYNSCHLVISSYQKSYQEHFDISLNYKILEIYCYSKKKNDKSIQFTVQKVITPVRFRQQPELLD